MSAARIRIGLVDKNLDNYHANVFLKHLRETIGADRFDFVGGTALEADASRAWTHKNNLRYFDDVAALNREVDAFMILAPSNPQTHLQLCEQVCPCGKPTYVDKTFAPDLPTAKKIFALADKHAVAMQTSSVLRYTNVQQWLKDSGGKAEHMIAWGGGGSFEEYAIHPLELTLSCMGPDVKRLLRRGPDDRAQLLLEFTDHRTAVVNVYINHKTGYAAAITTPTETQYHAVDAPVMWPTALRAILDFLAAGKPNIDRAETLTLMACRDAAMSKATRGTWVDVK